MDIAVGAKRVFVMMTHTTREGEPKVVEELTYPLTAKGVVSTIFTDMAVIAVTPEGFTLKEAAPGLTAGDVQDATRAPRIVADDLKSISV